MPGRPFLVPDIWLRILPFCGIRGVLAISQTCKHLRELACNKHVWLSLIRDLNARFFLDLQPGTNLHTLSAPALVSLARRTVRGPRTWSPTHGPPIVARSHRVHPKIKVGAGMLEWENEAKLVPGGRYILFSNCRNLECWDVAEDRLVWTHKSAWREADSPNVLKFAADVVDGGRAAVVVVCQRAFGVLRKNFVEIVRLDFTTGTSQLILLTLTPHTGFDNPFVHPKICGDLVLIGIHSSDQMLLVKPSTAETILLAPGSHDLANIDGHLVLTTADIAIGTVNVHVLSEEAMRPFWKPAPIPSEMVCTRKGDDDRAAAEEREYVVEENEPYTKRKWEMTSMEEIRKELSATIEFPAKHVVRLHRLSVQECPMVEGGEYVVWVYVSTSPVVRGGDAIDGFRVRSSLAVHSMICKFRLRIPSLCGGDATEGPSLRLLMTTNTNLACPVHEEISYAGHTEFYDYYRGNKQRVLALAEPFTCEPRIRKNKDEADEDEGSCRPENLPEVQLDGCGDFVHVSAYSGALTYATYLDLVVNYYE